MGVRELALYAERKSMPYKFIGFFIPENHNVYCAWLTQWANVTYRNGRKTSLRLAVGLVIKPKHMMPEYVLIRLQAAYRKMTLLKNKIIKTKMITVGRGRPRKIISISYLERG